LGFDCKKLQDGKEQAALADVVEIEDIGGEPFFIAPESSVTFYIIALKMS